MDKEFVLEFMDMKNEKKDSTSLEEYLLLNYSIEKDDFEIIFNEPEFAYSYYASNSELITNGELSYTGYNAAKINVLSSNSSINVGEYCIYYSPTLEKCLYKSGGLDNISISKFKKEVVRYFEEALNELAFEIDVIIGKLIYVDGEIIQVALPVSDFGQWDMCIDFPAGILLVKIAFKKEISDLRSIDACFRKIVDNKSCKNIVIECSFDEYETNKHEDKTIWSVDSGFQRLSEIEM
jgi:hypothetical protein